MGVYLRAKFEVSSISLTSFRQGGVNLHPPHPTSKLTPKKPTQIRVKSKETKSQVKALLLYLANSYFYNFKLSLRILHQHRILRNLRKNNDTVITKHDKRNGVVILDQKLYNNAIEEIISDTSQFKKLNEDPTLKRKAWLQRFLRQLKQKNFFNEIEYDKL